MPVRPLWPTKEIIVEMAKWKRAKYRSVWAAADLVRTKMSGAKRTDEGGAGSRRIRGLGTLCLGIAR